MAKLKTGRHTSAIKASRQAERRAQHNRGVRKVLKQVTKDLAEAVKSGDSAKTVQTYGKMSSAWDKAAKKGVVHWKTAARKKSRLAKLALSAKKS
ncbi:MAG: 30S ribosomal protein S20 [Elusimicrobiales bacterium]|nr:30S ribosomal protein S20 [Elusimicrobiales bacterium]